MSYTAEISRTSPTAFLFLVDQSGSMQEVTNGKSKLNSSLTCSTAHLQR